MSLLLASDRRLATLRKIQGFRSPRWLSFALLMFCVSSCVLTIAEQVANIDRVGEVGYGDNYILRTVLQFQKTGTISDPPQTPNVLPSPPLSTPPLSIL